MKKLFLFVFLLFFITLPAISDDDFVDFDMNQVDTASFSKRKAVTDEQFDAAIKQKMQRPKGIIQKIKEFGQRNKIENDANIKNFKTDAVGEMGELARDIYNKKPNLLLSTSILASNGAKIPVGHYQIQLIENNGKKYIEFLQGSKSYGKLLALSSKDNWDENKIIYSRIEYINNTTARVVFSNLDGCFEAFAKIISNSSF